ncbi:MAG: hypothetical protein LRY26_01210, partial [Bacilli bacterium]|nr:hypothetical protein [Bacilli bacterium]
MNPIEITSIKALPSDTKRGWFLIHQYSKNPITGEEKDLGVACGWPIKQGYNLSKETFVVVQKEYSIDEQIVLQLKQISKHMRVLKEKEKEINNLYITEISKGLAYVDLVKVANLKESYNILSQELENAVFF